jgi:hypothetical protein
MRKLLKANTSSILINRVKIKDRQRGSKMKLNIKNNWEITIKSRTQ